jgi:hypothetical protein
MTFLDRLLPNPKTGKTEGEYSQAKYYAGIYPGFVSYLGTPSGILKFHNPATKKEGRILMIALFSRVLLAMLVLQTSGEVGSQQLAPKPTQVPGSALKWVLVAAHEFERQKIDLDLYTIVINDVADPVVVIADLDKPAGALGRRYFEVKISRAGKKVVSTRWEAWR